MSVILETKTLADVKVIRRSWRTNIESPVGADVVVTAHREELFALPDGTIIKQAGCGQVNRALSAVVTEQVTLADGTVLTAAQVAEAVGAFIETWAAEDSES